METALTNPHDSFFKDLFTRQEAAHDFLKHYLPPDVAAALDPTRLEIRKDSFIDPDLQAHFSDILYRVGLVRGNAAYVYVLSEEQLRTIVLRVIEEGDELMPTIAEQWIEQGQAIGLEKGREEGREAALNILRRFLAQRFGVGLDHFDEAFRGFDLAALTHLSEAAFASSTLAEFEAALERLKATSGGSEQPEVVPPLFGE